jgi:hypothetical protein
MQPIICLIFICLQDDIGEQGFVLSSSRTKKPICAQGVACEPEALIVAALGGLVYFMSICVEISVKFSVGAFSSLQ